MHISSVSTFLFCLFSSLTSALAIPNVSKIKIRKISPSEIPLRLRTAKNPAYKPLEYKLPKSSVELAENGQGRMLQRRGVYLCTQAYFGGACFHVRVIPSNPSVKSPVESLLIMVDCRSLLILVSVSASPIP